MRLKGRYGYELRKAFGNPCFVISLGVALAISIWHAFESVSYALWADSVDHFYVSNQSCFANWIVVDCNVRVSSTIFFYVVPFLAALPFVWSFLSERMSGYASQLVTRETRSDWVKAKGVATFLTGFTVVVVPLLVNFVCVACFLPAYTPQVEESMTVGLVGNDLFSELFYRLPLMYVVAFIVLDGLLAGAWAVFVLSLSVIFKNRVSLIVIPYLALLLWQYVTKTAFTALGIVGCSLSMIDDMKGVYYSQPPDLFVIGVRLLLLLTASALLLCLQKRKEFI